MTGSYPLAAQTAYQDLLEAHRARMAANVPGTPILKELPHGKYWYARQRIGARLVDRYLGPDGRQLRALIRNAKTVADEGKAFDERCASLVAQLRAAGFPTLDRETGKVLNAMVRVGVFRLGGTLIGTHAFRLYSAELGVKFDATLAATEDVDVAAFENLKLVIEDQVNPSLAETFRTLNLEPAPTLDPKGRATRWRMRGGGPSVDFLAPRMQARSGVIFIEPLGVHAETLSFLNFLIAKPIAAVALYRSGLLVQVPAPEKYAVHKLIVASRRDASSAGKSAKDLAQAEALIEILAEDRPGELAAAWRDAVSRGPKWRDAIERSLKRRLAIRRRLDTLG